MCCVFHSRCRYFQLHLYKLVTIEATCRNTQAAANKAKLERKLAPDAFPLDYYTTLRVIRDAAAALPAPPVVAC